MPVRACFSSLVSSNYLFLRPMRGVLPNLAPIVQVISFSLPHLGFGKIDVLGYPVAVQDVHKHQTNINKPDHCCSKLLALGYLLIG